MADDSGTPESPKRRNAFMRTFDRIRGSTPPRTPGNARSGSKPSILGSEEQARRRSAPGAARRLMSPVRRIHPLTGEELPERTHTLTQEELARRSRQEQSRGPLSMRDLRSSGSEGSSGSEAEDESKAAAPVGSGSDYHSAGGDELPSRRFTSLRRQPQVRKHREAAAVAAELARQAEVSREMARRRQMRRKHGGGGGRSTAAAEDDAHAAAVARSQAKFIAHRRAVARHGVAAAAAQAPAKAVKPCECKCQVCAHCAVRYPERGRYMAAALDAMGAEIDLRNTSGFDHDKINEIHARLGKAISDAIAARGPDPPGDDDHY